MAIVYGMGAYHAPIPTMMLSVGHQNTKTTKRATIGAPRVSGVLNLGILRPLPKTDLEKNKTAIVPDGNTHVCATA